MLPLGRLVESVQRAYSVKHLARREADVLSSGIQIAAVGIIPRAILVVLAFSFCSTFFVAVAIMINMAGILPLLLAPWCTTPMRASVLCFVSAVAPMHIFAVLLLADGPLPFGIFSGILVFAPAVARLFGTFLSKRSQMLVVVYFWLLLHTIVLMRSYGFVVPSPPDLIDHGLTDTRRFWLNLASTNLTLFITWRLSIRAFRDEVSQAQDRLFASISHDMRQPCHAMSLLVTLIIDNMDTVADAGGVTEADTRNLLDSQKKDMRQLGGLVDTLLILINNFPLYSKLQQSPGLMPPSASVDFKLCDLLEEVSFVGAPLADQKQIGFEVQCDSLASDALLGPVADLKRILGNLVSNAINYTNSGRVTLSVKRIDTDTVATAPANPNVVRVKFEVQDTGAGIAKCERSKLWQPYVRGGTTPNFDPSPSMPLI
jgi:signal transduction histidine kinase